MSSRNPLATFNNRDRRRVAIATVAVLAVIGLLASFTSGVSFATVTPFRPAQPALGTPVPVTRHNSTAVPRTLSAMPPIPMLKGLGPGTHLINLAAPANGTGSASPLASGWHDVVPGLAISTKAADTKLRIIADPITKLSIAVLNAAQSRAAGSAGPAIELSRVDGRTAAAPVAVRLSDDVLTAAFGADYAARARWLQVPATAAAGARKFSSPLPVTRQPGTVATTALVGSSAVLLVATGSPISATGTGSFAATPLKPSDSWQVSAQTGDFSWSYPMRVPPAPAGPEPQVALQYDSQSVDGETGGTNNQPSVVGDGWSLAAAGSIDRSYTPCASTDGPSTAIPGSGDLCWSTANATVSFAGHSGALVRDAAGSWKLQGDDSTRVEQLTGTSNGTYDGDYWRLTTTDGTQYYFGLNRLPGWVAGNPVTNSAWTVPVCGTATSNCTGTATTAGPFNNQAWRWNLDYVVDPHGNAESYSYTADPNSYAKDGSGATSYVRGGELNEIDYGMRSANLFGTTAASGKALFGYSARCDTTQSGEPAGACNPATPVAQYWPDVPWDQNCTTSSCSQTSPSFWSTTMLSSVTTEVLSASSYPSVDVWTLGHSWPDPGDSTSAVLWLTQVGHTGHSGTASIATPTTTFHGVKMQNRVWVIDGLAPLVKWRIDSINTGSGDVTSIAYSAQQCTPSMIPALQAAPQSNTNRCFPAWWTPQTTPAQPAQLDFFHKYLVTTVDDDPTTGGAVYDQRHEADYLYTGTAAWRFDQSPSTGDGQRSWSVWAGYSAVEVRTGNPSVPATQHTTDYTFLQGLDGDPDGSDIHYPTSSTRSVVLTASDGTQVRDSLWWAGRVLEQVTRNGSSGGSAKSTTPVLSDVITVPWASAATASSSRSYTYTDPANGSTYHASLTTAAYLTGDGTVTTTSPTSTGSRHDTVTNTFDSYGRIVTVEDAASDADTTCTRTQYATNVSGWLIDYPSTVSKVGLGCSATPSYPADAVTATATCYDGQSLGVAPTAGDPTTTQVASAYAADGTPTWQTVDTETFDALGRVTLQTDPRTTPASSTTTAYTPAAGGPLTQTDVTTNPQGWTSSTTYLPAWGVEASTKDANNNLTTATYDALGRRASVWLPNRSQASYPTSPSISYTYTMSTTAPNTVATTSVNAAGGTDVSYAFYDGLGQLRQNQTTAEGGGIDVVDTSTDASGQTALQSAVYYATGSPSTTLVIPTITLPSQTQTSYDGAGRVTASTLLNGSTAVWSTTNSYLGTDRVDTDPPTGGTPTSTYTNLRGHTTKLVQYLADSISGSTETTSYGYDPRGDLTQLTDNAGNIWRWSYDVLGNQTSATDPDSGTTTKTYYPDGDLKTSTDAVGNQLTYTYDAQRRKTAEYNGPDTTGVQLAAWTYDTATAGLGALASSTRYVGGTAGAPGTGTAYQQTVAGYNSLGSPTGTTTVIGGSTPLAGSYTTSYGYALNGEFSSQTDPAEGGLPSEKITDGFDSLGQISGAGSPAGSIVTSISYTHLGQVGQTLQSQGAQVWRTYTYDTTTWRLTELMNQRNATANAVVSDDHYTYDQAGNVTEDNNTAGGITGTDTQCFGYDHLRDLTSAWTPANNSCTTAPSASMSFGGPAPYWNGYSVDPATGNRTSSITHTLSGGTVTGTTTSTYSYNTGAGAVQPHAVQSVANTIGGTTTTDNYSYNADGSATALPGQTISYDAEGHPAATTVTATAKTQTDVYDADGTLLLQTDPVTGTTAYLGDTQLHVAAGSSTVTGSRTYTVLGQAFAERDTTAGVTGTQYYFLDDDLHNTATAQVAAATAVVARRYLDPFGNTRGASSSWISNHQFLAAAQNPLTTASPSTVALSLLGAREYDPAIGKFLAVDPVLDPSKPQQLNGYSYAWNNPVTNSDPTGLRPADDGGAITGSNLQSWEHTENQAQRWAPIVTAASDAVDLAQAATNRAQKNYDKAYNYAQKGLQLYLAFVAALMEAASCGSIASDHEGGGGCGAIRISSDQEVDRESRHSEQRISQYFSEALDGSAESQALETATSDLDDAKSDLAQADCGSSGQSFTAGTLVVMADGSTKPIEQIKVGDKVRATDPATGKTLSQPATKLWLNHDTDLMDVTVTSGGKTSTIHATQHHPFWDETKHAWTEADNLAVGDRLHTGTSTVATVQATTVVTGAGYRWDLTVNNTHDFYIFTTAANVLVHNCSGYENPGHHDPTGGPNPYNPQKAVLPGDAEAGFSNSIEVRGVRWSKMGDGRNTEYYRYFNDGNNNWHWSGSTNGVTSRGTPVPIPMDQVPISVRRG